MKMNEEKSEIIQILDDLSKDGFTCSFSAQNGTLQCNETGKRFSPEELSIVSVQRYEGAKDLDDQTVLYAVTDGKDTRGVIIDSYGANADSDLAACIINRRTNKDAVPPKERPFKEEIS